MGRPFQIVLEGKSYSCKHCRSMLALMNDLMSKSFHCRRGKAYLFHAVVNISAGPQEERMMTTGTHVVSDIHCNCCQQVVGWKYLEAHDERQKYKEGKYILERAAIVVTVDPRQENGDDDSKTGTGMGIGMGPHGLGIGGVSGGSGVDTPSSLYVDARLDIGSDHDDV